MSSLNDEEFINLASKVAFIAKKDKVKSAQINELLNVLESEGDDVSSIKILQVFIMRQVNRDFIGRQTGNLLINILRDLSNKGAKRKEIRRFLSLVKWIYEGIEKVHLDFSKQVEKFEDLVMQYR